MTSSSSEKLNSVPAGADGGNSILIQNDVYQIDLGETESGFWIWPVEIGGQRTTTLYHELFALQAGDGPVTLSYNPTEVVDTFPDTGQPGEKYSCLIRYNVGGTELLVQRTVRMDESEPTFTLKYDVRNVGSVTIDELNFYEHADFDNGQNDFSDDVGFYQTSPEYVYTTDDSEYGGFSGDQTSDNHHVGEFPAYDELQNGNLNNQDQFPVVGSDDPVCILQWDLGTLEPDETTNITLQFGGAFSQEQLESNVSEPDEIETDPPTTVPDLQFEDLRLVQTVENTRYDASRTFNTYDESQIDDANQFFDDPGSFVAQKMAAVVFDIEGSLSTSDFLSEIEFELRVGDDTDTVTLSRDDVVIPAAQSQNTLLGRADDEGEVSNFPTFQLPPDASSVQVTLDTSSATLSQQTDLSRDIVEMPDLNIGFVGIRGDNVAYGGLNEADYEDFVDEAAQLFQSMYPTHRVNVVVADPSERHVDGILSQPNQQPGNRSDQAVDTTHLTNARQARDIIEDAINDSFTWGGLAPDDDSFADAFSIINGQRDTSIGLDDIDSVDYVTGITPNDYFDTVSGSSLTTGIHYRGQNDQPDAAGLAELRSPSSGPHEGGHHFLGGNFYAQNVAQNNGNDQAHADDNLRSTEYDLGQNSFSSDRASPSFMSYGGNEWMDTLVYNEMLLDEFGPDPSLDDDGGIFSGLFAVGEVSEDGIDIATQSIVQNRPVTDDPDSEVSVRVVGPDETVLDERSFPLGVTAQVDGGGRVTSSDNVFFGTAPLPTDALYVEIVAPTPDTGSGTVSTILNPYADSLLDILLAIPAGAIGGPYERYERFVTGTLAQVDEAIRTDEYGLAANVLEVIDRIVRKQVDPGYDTSPDSVKPKERIRSMISFRVERLRRLE